MGRTVRKKDMGKSWITSAHRGFVTENMHENTLSAFRLAVAKGADMFETDARMTRDGVLVANHDPQARGFDRDGKALTLTIAEVSRKELDELILAPNDPSGPQKVPDLADVLDLAYFGGARINIDLKDGIAHAEEVARLVCSYGMKGRCVYATNGAGPEAINLVRRIDENARFIDKPENFNAEKLSEVDRFQSSCFAYTADFSEENIRRIRESGVMLAAISLHAGNLKDAFRWHPDMAEYLHISDFETLENRLLNS